MLATLILLYALDTGQVPTGCYVAAWVFAILKYSWEFVKVLAKISEKYSKDKGN